MIVYFYSMKYAVFTILMFCSLVSFAQLSGSNKKQLALKEDSLKIQSYKIINGISAAERLKADSLFTRAFVRALKVPHSFQYQFDSIQTISKLYPPDSTFRIFTWQMVINENVIRQHGALQMKTADGSLKLFPLIDKSDVTNNIADTIGNNFGWIGAVYYKLISTKHNGQTYYTLLGYDENNIRSNKKIIEVLQFKNGQPLFGGRFFNTTENADLPKNLSRFVLEYKRATSPRLTYDAELDMIVMEHLISPTNEPAKKYTLIPDGDYEGFKWKDGQWNYVTKIFTLVTPENQPPTPSLILDAQGNIDETKVAGYEPGEKAPATPVKKEKIKKKD